MELWAITDKGMVRRQNQDAFCLCRDSSTLPFAVVCDGMGGAKAGNVASKLTVEVFKTQAVHLLTPEKDIEEVKSGLLSIAQLANDAVFQLSKEDPDCAGMGTTMVAAVIKDNVAVIMNIGDSRAYLVSNNDMKQITRDHSVVEDMVARGDITREESRTHPNKNLITRAVGTVPTIDCDLFIVPLEDEDTICLCTDGLTNTISDWELEYEVHHCETLELGCRALLEISLNRGAPDNVTIALIKK